jgi:hypothetical protein
MEEAHREKAAAGSGGDRDERYQVMDRRRFE